MPRVVKVSHEQGRQQHQHKEPSQHLDNAYFLLMEATQPYASLTILGLARQARVIPEAHGYKPWGVVTRKPMRRSRK